jgi:hypothetical protein
MKLNNEATAKKIRGSPKDFLVKENQKGFFDRPVLKRHIRKHIKERYNTK